MRRMRIELTRDRSMADQKAAELKLSGFRVEGPEAADLIWVTDVSDSSGLPAITYADPADKEVWVILGRK